MIIKINIRDNLTGETRQCKEYASPNHEDSALPEIWNWTEGNCGCDCNRRVVFAIAGNDAPPEESPCGDSQYSISIEHEGNIIYTEFEDD